MHGRGEVDISARRTPVGGQGVVFVLVRGGERFVVVLRVHHQSEPDLLLVGKAGRLPGFFAGLGEHGEEDGGEDGDDGDHHQQFDEGEGAVAARHGWHDGLRMDNLSGRAGHRRQFPGRRRPLD